MRRCNNIPLWTANLQLNIIYYFKAKNNYTTYWVDFSFNYKYWERKQIVKVWFYLCFLHTGTPYKQSIWIFTLITKILTIVCFCLCANINSSFISISPNWSLDGVLMIHRFVYLCHQWLLVLAWNKHRTGVARSER